MTTASIVISTYGDLDAEAAPGWTWHRLLCRAVESATGQADELILHHDPDPDPCALGRARNAGIEATTGEWVLCLDADDELAPGCVPALLAAEGDVRCPAYQYARPDGTWAETIIRRREPYLAGVAALMRRSDYLRVRYREDVPCLEDNDLWHRASLLGLRFVDVPEAVYRVHRRAGSRRLTKGRGVVRVQMESEARRWACSMS